MPVVLFCKGTTKWSQRTFSAIDSSSLNWTRLDKSELWPSRGLDCWFQLLKLGVLLFVVLTSSHSFRDHILHHIVYIFQPYCLSLAVGVGVNWGSLLCSFCFFLGGILTHAHTAWVSLQCSKQVIAGFFWQHIEVVHYYPIFDPIKMEYNPDGTLASKVSNFWMCFSPMIVVPLCCCQQFLAKRVGLEQL